MSKKRSAMWKYKTCQGCAYAVELDEHAECRLNPAELTVNPSGDFAQSFPVIAYFDIDDERWMQWADACSHWEREEA